VLIVLTRPYASVVTVGIAVELPALVAPGPVAGNAKVTVPVAALTVTFAAPLLDKLVTAVRAEVEIDDILPYASVVITGIAEPDPVVAAPGPTAVKLIVLPDIVTLPAPVDVYVVPPPPVLITAPLPAQYNPVVYTDPA
jgi:hypothetical protein